MGHCYAIVSSVVVLVAVCFLLPETYSLGIRPFGCTNNASSSGSSCSTETALATYGCPCKLNGQRCKGNGVICTKNICQCGSAFLNITVNGTTQCFSQCTATPTTTETLDSTVAGVVVPCSQVTNIPLPYNITFSGCAGPVNCDSTVLKLISVSSDDPTELAAGQTDTGCPDPVNAPNAFCPFIQVSGTGQIVGNSAAGVFPYATAPGTFFTQSYQGFCVAANGIASNTFIVKVTWPACPQVAFGTTGVVTASA